VRMQKAGCSTVVSAADSCSAQGAGCPGAHLQQYDARPPIDGQGRLAGPGGPCQQQDQVLLQLGEPLRKGLVRVELLVEGAVAQGVVTAGACRQEGL
jgi:hypothetical protein